MHHHDYQAYFCEENIWRLTDAPELSESRCYAVFISNHARQCPLWMQRAAQTIGEPVIWDYHVILLEEVEGGPDRIWDLDTHVGAPVDFCTWWRATFPILARVYPEFWPMFRVIPAQTYREELNSDRSHMLAEDGTWRAQPPVWDAPFDPAKPNNLQALISMEREGGLGEVLDHEAFSTRWG